MTVVQAVRETLASRRQMSIAFEKAWPVAVRAGLAQARTERDDWKVALEATRATWQAAYERTAATRRLRALTLVAEDRVTTSEWSGRSCQQCGGPIPAGKKSTARYCRHACQRAANGRQVVAA